MSPREMSADHLWSLTIPVASTGPKLTPKVTPYGADARAIPGHPRKRKSAKVREFLSKMHRWTPPDAGGTAGTDLLIRVSLVRSQRGPPINMGINSIRTLLRLGCRVHIGSTVYPGTCRPGNRGVPQDSADR